MNQTIPLSAVLDIDNWTVWSGYMETPISFNPIGDEWIGDLNPYRFIEDEFTGEVIAELPLSVAFDEWKQDNLTDILLNLESMGFKVVGDRHEED